MNVYLPADFAHCLLGFTGTAAPTGAAITFGVGDTAGNTSPTAIATTIISLWGTHIDSLTSNQLTFSSCRVKKGPMEDGPFAELATANVGGQSGDSTQPNTTWLVRKITNLGGKMGQGRMYVPGVGDSIIDQGGTITSANRTSYEAAWSAFFAAINSAGYPMMLLHTFGDYVNSKGQTVVVPARGPSQVTALTVDSKVATQRRRLRR